MNAAPEHQRHFEVCVSVPYYVCGPLERHVSDLLCLGGTVLVGHALEAARALAAVCEPLLERHLCTQHRQAPAHQLQDWTHSHTYDLNPASGTTAKKQQLLHRLQAIKH